MRQPPDPDDPTTVGGFRIVGALGTGGMGRVLLGEGNSGRLAAITVVHADLAADPGFRARFGREVRAAAKAPPGWTAPFLDADPDAERPWLATAYLDAPSLREYLADDGPLDPVDAAGVGSGLAAALSALHSAGLVHGDLTPSTVLLTSGGPRLIGFGISRAVDGTAPTTTGRRVGTPEYLSPEQATGTPAGTPSDVFALGSLLAFAVLERTPFADGSPTDTLHRVVHDEPDLAPGLGPLEPVVRACLAKNPAGRPTARQARDRLAAIATGRPDPAPAPRPAAPPPSAPPPAAPPPAAPPPAAPPPAAPPSVAPSPAAPPPVAPPPAAPLPAATPSAATPSDPGRSDPDRPDPDRSWSGRPGAWPAVAQPYAPPPPAARPPGTRAPGPPPGSDPGRAEPRRVGPAHRAASARGAAGAASGRGAAGGASGRGTPDGAADPGRAPWRAPGRRRVALLIAGAVLVAVLGVGGTLAAVTLNPTPAAGTGTATGAPARPAAPAATSDPAAGATVVDTSSDTRYGDPAARLRFASPSGNIVCTQGPSDARCDVAERTWRVPPAPAGCRAVYGAGVALGSTAALTCGGSAADASSPSLGYGRALRTRDLVCVSRSAGVECRNTRTGHGFVVSRAEYRLY